MIKYISILIILITACSTSHKTTVDTNTINKQAQQTIIKSDSITLHTTLSTANSDSIKKTNIKPLDPFEQLSVSKTFEYTALKKELNYLKTNNITYNPIKYPGFTLRKGDSNRYVIPLKKRFHIPDSTNMKFNKQLEDSIKKFQVKHCLTPDGIAGSNTYHFLSWSKQDYISILQKSIEKLHQLSDTNFSNSIIINIPSYTLELRKNDSVLFSSKVIVGKYKTKTPEYSSAIDYIVFNPCWTIPNSIATKKILPKIQKDTTWLERHNMFIGQGGDEINVSNIDFSQYSEQNFPYKIYQRSGRYNALGKVKFMFENPYSIYLHDTPSKSLFNKDIRALSHGCIRVQNAMALAKVILTQVDPPHKNINYYTQKGYPIKAYLNKKIPIHIIYLRAFGKDGEVYYTKDIY